MTAEADKKIVDYTFLSNNCGLKVSNLCLGAMTFGENKVWPMPGNTDEAGSHKILDRYAELGGNFIDTADIYCNGESERHIGTWMKKRGNRDECVIATKVRFGYPPANRPNDVGLSRKHIMKSVKDSLERLQTDYIDLYQIHGWDSAVPIMETLQALNDLVRQGKVHYVGGSNLSGWQLQKIVDYNRHLGFAQFVSLQQQYSLIVREMELEQFDVCKNEGIGVLPWSPLKMGLLCGKIRREDQTGPIGSRFQANRDVPHIDQILGVSKALNDDRYWNLIDTMTKIANVKKKTVPQVALRWCLQRHPVTSVIIGAKNLVQLNDNMGASSGWSLNDEEMAQLTDASFMTTVDYPYGMINMSNADRQHPGVVSGYL